MSRKPKLRPPIDPAIAPEAAEPLTLPYELTFEARSAADPILADNLAVDYLTRALGLLSTMPGKSSRDIGHKQNCAAQIERAIKIIEKL